MRSRLGSDCWSIILPFTLFLNRAREHDLELHHLRQSGQEIRFLTPVFQRRRVRSAFPEARLITTNGAIGFLLRNFSRPSRVICLIVSAALWNTLALFVFDVEVRGDSDASAALITETLHQRFGPIPLFDIDEQELETSLEDELGHALKWMEIEKEGSRLIIRFTSASHAQSETLREDDLIAQRDGVIAGFDVQHGYKRVALNQTVKKGDVLVSSLMEDSRGNAEHLYVKGRVFAYTWEEVQLETAQTAVPRPLQFFSLLLQARAKITDSFLKDDRIIAENILQFSEKAGTIKLVVHYTLYRDISSPV